MIIDQNAYWVWLQHAFQVGGNKAVSVGRRFSDLEEFYEGGPRLWSEFQFISDAEIRTLKTFTPQHAMAQIEYCENCDQEVISYAHQQYPEKLRNITNPPAVLYVKGKFPDFDKRLSISVVGTRKASQNAINSTQLISYELSKEGVIVVSGGALGIDTAAHKGALRSTSPTVAILACGIDYPYLMQNQNLREEIVAKGGALVTEYPVNSGINKGNFLIRNRIISGLSEGLLVSECGEKGGTMITVKHAVEQNKQIFAFPSQSGNKEIQGTNKLILDGAKPVLEVKDILDEFRHNYIKDTQELDEKIENDEIINSSLSKNAIMIYTIIGKDKIHVAKIGELTGLRVSQVLAGLTELELEGLIKTYSGQRFSR